MFATPAQQALAISKNEFANMLSKCIPPYGWPNKIGVAHSGGPDSTCLMFLLNQYVQDHSDKSNPRAQQVLSMTVDHGLQEASAAMTAHCAQSAKRLGIQHVSSKVAWGTHPYPNTPPQESRLESVARSCRFYELWRMMKAADVKVIAFGQHADDQVETALMRLAKGSTEYGAGGMRACRRWGMGLGAPGSLSFYGQEGLHRWIIRPLLDVSKDRILATCDEYGLEYVTDKTNFQPKITLRNAIRHQLQTGQPWDPESVSLPKDIASDMKAIQGAVKRVSIPVDLSAGREHLRDTIKTLTSQVDVIDHKVSAAIDACRTSSPPGTLLMRSARLCEVDDELVKSALVLRVLRYVSSQPWGSIKASAGRRSLSIQQIIDKLWNPHPFTSGVRAFAAGGEVLWTPVIVKGGNIKRPHLSKIQHTQDTTIGWLASRQPPINKNNPEAIDMRTIIEPDITHALLQGIEKRKDDPSSSIVEVLYDNRYLLNFDLSRIPADIFKAITVPDTTSRIKISPAMPWYIPHVYIYNEHTNKPLHSDIQLHRFLADKHWKKPPSPTVSNWINVEWIRPLEQL